AERPLPPVRLRDEYSTNRLGSVRSTLQLFRKVSEMVFQFLAVVPPRLPILTRSRFPLHLCSRDQRHMTRGQSGPLTFLRVTLSLTTTRRFSRRTEEQMQSKRLRLVSLGVLQRALLVTSSMPAE